MTKSIDDQKMAKHGQDENEQNWRKKNNNEAYLRGTFKELTFYN